MASVIEHARADSKPRRVRDHWSGADVTQFGPYREAQALRLLAIMWNDPALEAEFLRDPAEVLARETDLDYSAQAEIVAIKEVVGEFTFVVPAIPPAPEKDQRLTQMNDWYVVGWALWWQNTRRDAARAAPFRSALEVAIIQRTFAEAEFRRRMLDDPRSALEEELGSSFPPDLEVMSVEDTAERVHLVVPKRPDLERLDSDFEHQAGWFAAMHQFWWWMVSARVHTPLPGAPIVGKLG